MWRGPWEYIAYEFVFTSPVILNDLELICLHTIIAIVSTLLIVFNYYYMILLLYKTAHWPSG